MKKLCTILIFCFCFFNFGLEGCLVAETLSTPLYYLEDNSSVYFDFHDCLNNTATFRRGKNEVNVVTKATLQFIDTNVISDALDGGFPSMYSSSVTTSFNRPQYFLLWFSSINSLSKIILFYNNGMTDFKILKLPKGQGPFEVSDIGNVFLLGDSYVGITHFNKIMMYKVNSPADSFRPVFSGKLRKVASNRNKKIMTSVGNCFLLFSDKTDFAEKGVSNWYSIYKLKDNVPVFVKSISKDNRFLTRLMSFNKKKNHKKTTMEIMKEMVQLDRIVVLPGFNHDEFYFFNPMTGVFAHFNLQDGKLLNHTCWNTKFTDYEVKIAPNLFAGNKNAFANNQGIVVSIKRNLFDGTLWVLRKPIISSKSKRIAKEKGKKVNLANCPTWDIFDMKLNYIKTVRLYVPATVYEKFFIHNFLITADKQLTVFAFVKKWGEKGNYSCLNITLSNL